MRIAQLSLAALAAVVTFAPAARADEFGIGFSYGSGDRGPRHRGHDHVSGFVELGLGGPAHVVRRPERHIPRADAGQILWLPERTVWREQVVTDPAVYETRRVPVFETVSVPVYDTRRVPVYDVARGPRLVGGFETRHGGLHVSLGEAGRRVRVGERVERVQVGVRTERVQTGERLDQILVRPATTRVVRVPETIPGRFVLVVDRPHGGHRHRDARHGEVDVMTRVEFEAALAETRPAGRFDSEGRFDGRGRFPR
jgi:hypothetical protein